MRASEAAPGSGARKEPGGPLTPRLGDYPPPPGMLYGDKRTVDRTGRYKRAFGGRQDHRQETRR